MIEVKQIQQVPKIIITGLSVVVFFMFFYILYGYVFSQGVTPSDEAYIATGAKNLAFGYGYSSSITPDGSYGLSYFPPGFTTGPTLILPAALLIRTFGNNTWVPGFSSTTINLLLLVLIYLSIRKKMKFSRGLAYFWLLFFLLYNFTAGENIGHWCALLGEVPAALLSILGIFILIANPDKRSAILISCLAFGLAFMTKMLSLLGFIPVLVWFTTRIISQKSNRKKLVINYFMGIFLFLLPFILFEIYKFSVLGIEAYIKNYHDFFLALSLWHDVGQISEGIGFDVFATSLVQRFTEFKDHFGFSIISLFLVACLIGTLICFSKKNKYVNTIFFLFLAGSFLHLLWWICLSNGRPRYAFIGLFLYFAAISCTVLLNISRIMTFSMIIVFILVFHTSFKNLLTPIEFVIKHHYNLTRYETNLLKTVELLKKLEQKRPFIYTNWATVSDLDYSLPTVMNFKRMDYLEEGDFQRDLILVKNSKWVDPFYSLKFKNQERQFNKILLAAPPFQVVRYQTSATVLETEIPIDFSENGNSGEYVTFGWDLQATIYRRTNKARAGMCMRFNDHSGNDLVLRVLGHSLIGKSTIKTNLINVIFNNRNLTQWKMDNEKWYEVIIPSKFIKDSTNSIIFEIADRFAPVDFNSCSEANRFGIAVKQIVVCEKKNDVIKN